MPRDFRYSLRLGYSLPHQHVEEKGPRVAEAAAQSLRRSEADLEVIKNLLEVERSINEELSKEKSELKESSSGTAQRSWSKRRNPIAISSSVEQTSSLDHGTAVIARSRSRCPTCDEAHDEVQLLRVHLENERARFEAERSKLEAELQNTRAEFETERSKLEACLRAARDGQSVAEARLECVSANLEIEKATLEAEKVKCRLVEDAWRMLDMELRIVRIKSDTDRSMHQTTVSEREVLASCALLLETSKRQEMVQPIHASPRMVAAKLLEIMYRQVGNEMQHSVDLKTPCRLSVGGRILAHAIDEDGITDASTSSQASENGKGHEGVDCLPPPSSETAVRQQPKLEIKLGRGIDGQSIRISKS